MTGILFVCYGNICRSPMAEFVMKDLTEKAGLQTEFLIESAATSPCNAGSGVYPPARRMLSKHGIDCAGKQARPLEHADYKRFDFLIGMDNENIREMRRICGGDPDGKIRLLLDFTGRPGNEKCHGTKRGRRSDHSGRYPFSQPVSPRNIGEKSGGHDFDCDRRVR